MGVDDVDQALSQYAKYLRRYSFDELEAGWEKAVYSHKRRDWPSIAELNECIRAVRPGRSETASAPRYQAPDEVDRRTPEEKARVTKLLDIWRANGKSFLATWNDPDYQAMCREIGNVMPDPEVFAIDPVVEGWRADLARERRVASDAGASETLKAIMAKRAAQ